MSPSCFTCPLPKCKYEMTASEAKSAQKMPKRIAITEAHDAGLSVTQIAAKFNVSTRTVSRALHERAKTDGSVVSSTS